MFYNVIKKLEVIIILILLFDFFRSWTCETQIYFHMDCSDNPIFHQALFLFCVVNERCTYVIQIILYEFVIDMRYS